MGSLASVGLLSQVVLCAVKMSCTPSLHLCLVLHNILMLENVPYLQYLPVRVEARSCLPESLAKIPGTRFYCLNVGEEAVGIFIRECDMKTSDASVQQ